MIFHSVLVTGANRGIGLQFVREFLRLGNSKIANVIATYRDPKTADELNELAKSNDHLNLLQLDIKNYASHNEFRDKLSQITGDKGLSLLLNNAGVAIPTNFDNATPEKMIENFEINAVTPLMLSKALLPLLERSSKGGHRTLIAHISSQKGSVGENLSGGFYGYRASKSALNQIGKSMSVDLMRKSVQVVMLHPGWVKTRMGGDKAPLSPDQTVSNMVKILVEDSRDLNGKFLNHDGKELPW